MDSNTVDEFAVSSRSLARRAFGRAARLNAEHGYSNRHENRFKNEFEKIPQELSQRLLLRLSSLAIEPAVVLDIGTPQALRQTEIRQMYPKALLVQSAWHELQFASAHGLANQPGKRLRRLVSRMLGSAARGDYRFSADPGQLPLTDNSVDLVLACQVLPWIGDPGTLFLEVQRVLKPGGAFFWSSVGPDTLTEYRQLWSTIDTYPHVFGLQDMHDLGDDMLRSGFDSPVMDRENLNINYASVATLHADLRAAGAANLASGRRKGLMATTVPNRLVQSTAGLSVTIEHIQGHGWKVSDSRSLRRSEPASGGSSEVRIPLADVGRYRPGKPRTS